MMKQLGISFSSNFDDNAFGNVGIRILSRVAYPISPLTENKTSGRNASILKRFVVPRVPRERKRETEEKRKEDKEEEKKKERGEEKREKVAKKRKRLGDEILESSILRVRGDSRAARGTAAWNRCIREKREERGSADSWMVMEEDRKRFGDQPYPELLLAMPGISLSHVCEHNSYEGGFELLEISLNVLLINLERLKGMKWSKVYGGFGNLKMKFGVVNMFWGMRKV